MCSVAWRFGPWPSSALAAGLCLVLCGAWFGLSARIQSRVESEVRHRFPAAVLDEVVVTPLPANPLCYAALAVQHDAERYTVRRASVALVPALLPAEHCPRSRSTTTAPLAPVPAASTPALSWQGQFQASRSELDALYRKSCQVRAFLRWSRVPYWKRGVIGDLRYDFSPALEFAELRLDPAGACPRWLPAWRPPRAALLPP
jgi:inner membrane protein